MKSLQIMISFIILFLMIFTNLQAKSVDGRIGVLLLKNQAKLSEDEIFYLTSQIQERVQLKTKNKYQVITQENVTVLLSNQKTLEDCIEGRCEIEIGKKLGAYLLITGTITRFGTQAQMKCTLNLHETENGKMLSIQTIKAKDIDDLEKRLPLAVEQLIEDALSYDIIHKNLNERRYQKKFNELGIEMEMVWIKEGHFEMSGAPSRGIGVQHFFIGKKEVTNQQYFKCVQAGVCTKPHWDDFACLVFEKDWMRGILSKDFREDHQPVVCIDWGQARAFSKWVGGDLPTEVQWEYVARSRGEYHPYPWGIDLPSCQYAVMFDGAYGCHTSKTAFGCSKAKGNTKEDVCDMIGNVAEWILDEWHPSYEGARLDDLPWCQDLDCSNPPHIHRVFRGGSWINEAPTLKSRSRNHMSTNYKATDLGFRVVIRAE